MRRNTQHKKEYNKFYRILSIIKKKKKMNKYRFLTKILYQLNIIIKMKMLEILDKNNKKIIKT